VEAAETGWINERVSLKEYDPNWVSYFEAERAALHECIGSWIAGGIHRIGSTAVPGLAAKPIIDILVGVADLEQSRPCIDRLEALTYRYLPYRTEVMHWFCKLHRGRRTHHLHLVPTGSRRYDDELAFRDALRADPSLAARYATLKKDLAARFADDRDAYTQHKTPFIREVLGG
jgi:GrpB-like predicted nucleotidyltransferase (UPF0157 family)